MTYIGELIAISTVLCWTMSAQFFEAASRRVGPTPVNIIRITFALALFSILLVIRNGFPVPLHFSAHAWFYLSLSGIIGFFLGDIFLFKALVEIGARVAMLIFSLSAPTTAIIGWLFLDEVYALHQWVGIFVTIFGVGMVVFVKNSKPASSSSRIVRTISFKGILFSIGGMLGQAIGFILSKAGMKEGGEYLDAFSATQIRVIAAFVCFILFLTVTKKWQPVGAALKDKKALLFTATGAVVGPFFIAGSCVHHPVFHFPSQGTCADPGHGRSSGCRRRDLSAHGALIIFNTGFHHVSSYNSKRNERPQLERAGCNSGHRGCLH